MEFKVPFGLRAHHYSEQELSEAVRILRGDEPLTQGENLKKFEQEICRFADVSFGFAVSSATAGLEIAASLCQIDEGEEIIMPAHTYTSSAYPFAKRGGSIVWADIDPGTRVVTAETLEACVTSRTKVIVVPHLYGYGVEMGEIMDLAQRSDIFVIEDAAQAIGVKVDGAMVGSFGHAGVYSFHSHKNLTTLGEGGVLVTREAKWGEVIPALRHNGHRPYLNDRSDYWIPAMTDVILPKLNGKPVWPMNCCLGELPCAIGTKVLSRIDGINTEKRNRALRVIDSLAEFPELVFHRETSSRHNYYLLAARLDGPSRDEFIRHMANHHSVQCVVQYYPLNRYPFYRELGFGNAAVPETDRFYDNMVSFPFSHVLSEEQIDYVIDATRETLEWLRAR